MTGLTGLFFDNCRMEERETWAAELAGPEEISVLERDFDGHVLNKRIHLIIAHGFALMMGVSSRRFRT